MVSMSGEAPASRRRRVAAIAFLAGAGVWLLTHPYAGITGGPALYGLLALDRVDPGAFGADLFLHYGSQDSFTLFSPLYGTAVRWFGLLSANIVLLLAAYALWLTGAWLLAHRLVRGLPGHFAFLLMCAAPAVYGAGSILSAGENAVTARPFAEALVMLGLAALLARAWLRGGAAFLAAVAIHPIMALPGLGTAFLVMAQRRRVILWAVPAGAAAVLILTLAHVEPFGRLAVQMDGPWLAAVKAHDPGVFAAAWTPGDWASLIADLAICAATAAWTTGSRRTLFIAVSLVAVGGIALTAAGGDLAHDALIIQLQTWRCAWLLAVVKLLALVVIWLKVRRRASGPLACALLAAPLIILTPLFKGPAWAWGPAMAMSVAGCVLALLILAGRQPRLSAGGSRVLLYVIAALPLAACATGAAVLWASVQFWRSHPGGAAQGFDFMPVRLLLFAFAVALVLTARRGAGVAAAAVGLMLTAAVLTWDARSPWERYILSEPPLPIALAPRAQILWDAEGDDVWFLLRRPDYVAITQANGLLFNRTTALEWTRREKLVRQVLDRGDWPQPGPGRTCRDVEAPTPREIVAGACRVAAGLDGVVLSTPVAGAQMFRTPAAQTHFCASRAGPSTYLVDRFYYLPCSEFRAASGSRAPTPDQ
jgi:hypothetical protein